MDTIQNSTDNLRKNKIELITLIAKKRPDLSNFIDPINKAANFEQLDVLSDSLKQIGLEINTSINTTLKTNESNETLPMHKTYENFLVSQFKWNTKIDDLNISEELKETIKKIEIAVQNDNLEVIEDICNEYNKTQGDLEDHGFENGCLDKKIAITESYSLIITPSKSLLFFNNEQFLEKYSFQRHKEKIISALKNDDIKLAEQIVDNYESNVIKWLRGKTRLFGTFGENKKCIYINNKYILRMSFDYYPAYEEGFKIIMVNDIDKYSNSQKDLMKNSIVEYINS